MFWKKRRAVKGSSKSETKELSPKEIIINQIQQLAVGKVLKYQLPEVFGGELAVIEFNSQYLAEKRQKKYILSLEKLVDGRSTGKRSRFLDSNKPKELAGWIVGRYGELVS